ncbi:protocadherin Fat 4-like [Protopterus annectens]|uniref:protocadherin Fat 4-like n=1 Tax=Protopterus annectens TaxID=7888 RepID=UPI001CFA5F47|nr:protocadherin Fat 4-like [Protopterus annectens]
MIKVGSQILALPKGKMTYILQQSRKSGICQQDVPMMLDTIHQCPSVPTKCGNEMYGRFTLISLIFVLEKAFPINGVYPVFGLEDKSCLIPPVPESGSKVIPEMLIRTTIQAYTFDSYKLRLRIIFANMWRMLAGGMQKGVIFRELMAASLKVDECHVAQPSELCFASSPGTGTERLLDTHFSNMVIGGIHSIYPILQRQDQVKTDDFVGCIKEFKVNGIRLDPDQAITSYNIKKRCSRLEPMCHNSTCMNNDLCTDHWFFYICQCMKGFTGPHCEQKISALIAIQFDGKSRLDYIIKESFKRKIMKEHLEMPTDKRTIPMNVSSMEIKFLTRKMNGLLVHIQEGTSYTSIKIFGGKLLYTSETGQEGYTQLAMDEITVSDGQWHLLALERDVSSTKILLDNQHFKNVTSLTQDFGSSNVEIIYLGGMPYSHSRFGNEPGFDGCIEYFMYNNMALPFSGMNEMAVIHFHQHSVQVKCTEQESCSSMYCSGESVAIACLTHPCHNGGTCFFSEDGVNYCICKFFFTGPLCELCLTEANEVTACGEMESSIPYWALAVSVPAVLSFSALVIIAYMKYKRTSNEDEREKRRTLALCEKGKDNKAFEFDDTCVTNIDVAQDPERQSGVIKGKNGQNAKWSECHESEHYNLDKTSSISLFGNIDITLCHPVSNPENMCQTSSRTELQSLETNMSATNLTNAELSMKKTLAGLPPFLREHMSVGYREHLQVTKLATTVTSSCPSQKRSLAVEEAQHSGKQYSESQLMYGSVPIRHKYGTPMALSSEEVEKIYAPRLSMANITTAQNVAYQNAMMHRKSQMIFTSTEKEVDTLSSDSDSYSSFTCSEYGCDKEAFFLYDHSNVTMCRKQIAVGDATTENHKTNKSDVCQTITWNLDEDTNQSASFCSHSAINISGNWKNLINIGPRLEDYVEVFKDLAEIPFKLKKGQTVISRNKQ